MASNRTQPLVLATFSSTALTTSWQAVNGTGFAYSPFTIRLTNGSSEIVQFSFDGVNAHEQLRPNSDFTLETQTNAAPLSWVNKWPAGTIVYVKATAAGSGTNDISVSGYYNATNV